MTAFLPRSLDLLSTVLKRTLAEALRTPRLQSARRVMSTTTKLSASHSTLDAIEDAFNSVWRTLYAQVKSDHRQSDELKIQLSQTLVALASDGITDPRELRRKALESMAFSLR